MRGHITKRGPQGPKGYLGELERDRDCVLPQSVIALKNIPLTELECFQ